MEETRYCLCCGEEVTFNRVEREGKVELTCMFCGFPLSFEEKTIVPMQNIAEETVQRPAAKEPVLASGEAQLRYILMADDSKFTRKIIKDLLVEKRLANEILDFENGLELTSAFAKLITEGKAADTAIILDINMPVMDGISAAKFIRNIESERGLPHVPIAFFSSVKADDNLRNTLAELAPANYVNKSSDPNPDRLAERVEQLLTYFMQMK
ncbi:MAG: response regulator [Nitrospirae bacterium]|nr:response regulator [Nitrospirota bacterium]